MRIHSLRLRGIGPFQHEQYIDVDEVGQQGLFLLDGPTGAGKSTIVDAIVYALFGQTAAVDGQDRMVSDFLGEDVAKDDRPFVELVFSTPAGAFRVQREPKCPYINKNGRPAEHSSTARLWRLPSEAADGEGDLYASGNQEVGSEIVGILGLNREQVLSTMVLAQGQFATFLRAKSEERRTILQSVFNTARYERLQNALLELRKKAYRHRDDAKAVFVTAVTVFLKQAELPGDAGEFAGQYRLDPAGQQQVVAARLAELGRAADELHQKLAALEASSTRADQELAGAQEAVKRITEKEGLLRRLAELQAQTATIADLAADIERARQADKVAVAHDALQTRQRNLAGATSRAEELAAGLTEAERDLGPAELDGVVQSVVAQQAALQDAAASEDALPELEAKLADLVAAIRGLADALVRDKSEHDALPGRIEELEAEAQALAATVAGLPAAQQAQAQAGVAAELLREIEGLVVDEAAQQERAEDAGKTADAADEKLRRARARYREGIAAELADGLAPGHDCPVCGSDQHPRVATKTADHVTVDEVERLERDWRVLDEAHNKARADLAALRTKLAGKRELLGGQDRNGIELARTQADLRVREAEAAKRRTDEITADLKVLRTRQEQLGQKLGEASQDHARRCANRDHLTTTIEDRRRSVAEGRGTFATVRQRLEDLARRQRHLESVRSARQEETGAAVAAADAGREFAELLARSPFGDEAQFLAAVRPDDWITESEQRVNQHGKDLQEVQSGLASDRLRDVDETQRFDLAALESAAGSARRAAEDCRGRWATAAKVRDDAAEAAVALDTDWSTYRRIDADTRPIIRLANMVNGDADNLHKIKLATYVVMRRFGDVVDAANSHLAEMSDGRYRLEVAGGVAGEKKMGLGLNVYDDRTDAPRSPTTLSGGETFYVSLSLALGLADVVQSESGGVSLETLFVDEGFGSLDAETLDTVMNVLTRLGRGHRTVGLISHVEELKRRVPDRVEIHRPDPNGPSQVKPPV